MTDSLSDDARLRATEAQMRRALGLHNASPTQDRPIPPTASPGASSPQRRRFVRDGEVPVSVIRRDQDDGANTNKLDATRQALREQIEAREQAEHLLQEAQATIRDLQTKLAHERLARDEAIRVWTGEKQAVEQALQRVQDELADRAGLAGRRPSRSAMTPLQAARRPRSGRVTPSRARRRRKILRPLAPSDRREERRTPAQSVWPRTLSL